VPYIKMILQKQKASPLITWFEFAPEEVDFLVKMGRY